MFTPRLLGRATRRFGRQLLPVHHLTGIELYPKQDRLISCPGSLVRLPLGVHRLTDQRYPLVDVHGQPLAPNLHEQLALLANPERVPPTFIGDVLARGEIKTVTPPSAPFRSDPLSPSAPLSERLKARISVYDYVSRYVDLDAARRGHCPFVRHEAE